MTFPIAIKGELLKTKRTSVIYIAIITAAIIPLIMLFFNAEEPEAMKSLKQDPWNIYFEDGSQPLNLVFLPLFIILITSLVPQLEHRNNTWKQVLASPQSKFNIYFSKFLIIQLLILLFLVVYNILVTFSLFGVHTFRSNLSLFSHSMNWKKFLTLNANIYISILAISAFQFWLGVRFKNFIIPLAIGFGLWMTAITMVGIYKWEHADKFPFAFPFMTIQPEYKTLPFVMWSSFVYCILFYLIGFLDFAKSKRRGI